MLYLSFPVAMFWVSNQAEYFEEYIVKRKVSKAFYIVFNHAAYVGFYSCDNISLFSCSLVMYVVQREIFPPDENTQVSSTQSSCL